MMTPFCVVLICLFVISDAGNNDEGIFTSNTDLQNLLSTEAELVKGMHRFIAEEEAKIAKLKE